MALANQNNIILEAYSQVDEQAHIHGVALIPRISRNNNLYTKKELARFHNMQVPLNWEHDPNKNIGSVTFQFNPETEQVFYDGMITDDAAATLARNRTLYTSIEAEPVSSREVCNAPGDCFHMPFGLKPLALALTETPGVPETSVKVIEHYIQECKHDSDLEAKYAPDQTNLKNEQHIEDLTAQEQGNDVADPCVSKWISKLADEEPSMPQDQRIAIAFSKCGASREVAWLAQEFFKFKEMFVCSDCGELKKN